MDPFTGATLLFSGISKVKELFNSGKKLMTDISGKQSAASTPEELRKEFDALPAEKQQGWIDQMAAATNQYEAETERLKAQEEISTEIAEKVDVETASEIAYQRQTTRPWTVRKMVYLMLFPFYLIALDVIQKLAKNWLFFWTDLVQPFESFTYVFGSKDGGLMDKLGNIIGPMPKTMAGHMYVEAIGYGTAIILTYMTLREVGKSRDKGKGDGLISKAVGSVKKLGFLGKIFGK